LSKRSPRVEVAAVVPNVRVPAGSVLENCTLRVEDGVVANGVVLDETTGEGVSNVQIIATSGGEYISQAINDAFTDSEGRFEIRVPRRGSAVYVASYPTRYYAQ